MNAASPEAPGRGERSSPKVSVVIATRDRAASLRETLRSLAAVHVPADLPTEVVVIDNGSTDETGDVVTDFARGVAMNVVYVVEPRPGKCRALNVGLERAAGDVFVFSDDDIRFPPDWIEGMSRPILEGRADTVQGGVRWAPANLSSRYATSFVASVVTSTAHKTAEELETGLIGANMAISRRAYARVGAFDEELGPSELGAGEETLLGWQLIGSGSRHLVALDVSVEHHFETTRITRRWLLESADKKGRSLGYIDFHWRHEDPRWTRLQLAVLSAKDPLRTLVTPAAWPGRPAIPEWKYAYRSLRGRLRQLRAEAAGGSARNYAYLGLRKSPRAYPPHLPEPGRAGVLHRHSRPAGGAPARAGTPDVR
jgi:glycosyltransferase involved in cell wall biosynthesis